MRGPASRQMPTARPSAGQGRARSSCACSMPGPTRGSAGEGQRVVLGLSATAEDELAAVSPDDYRRAFTRVFWQGAILSG